VCVCVCVRVRVRVRGVCGVLVWNREPDLPQSCN